MSVLLPRGRRVHIGRWVLGGLLIYALAFLLLAPASLVPWYLHRQARQALDFEHMEGTLWRGTARQAYWIGADGQRLPLGQLQWRLHFLPLLMGRVALTVHVNGPAGRLAGDVERQGRNWHLADLRGQVPVAYWAARQPRLAVLEPGGVVSLNFPALDLGPAGVKGSGEMQWQNATFKMSPVNPIGSYRIHLRDQNLSLDTLSGALRLEGQGSFQAAARQIDFTGSARPEGPAAARLAPVLYLLGPDQGGGVHSFHFTFGF